jgi:hypothetical protein
LLFAVMSLFSPVPSFTRIRDLIVVQCTTLCSKGRFFS